MNLSSYYATSEARNWQVSWIQSGFAGKNKSTIQNGDLYYFSGKHMYETTNGETYGRPENTKAKVEKLSVEEEDLRVKNRLHTYAVAKAVVGKTRIGKNIDVFFSPFKLHVCFSNSYFAFCHLFISRKRVCLNVLSNAFLCNYNEENASKPILHVSHMFFMKA